MRAHLPNVARDEWFMTTRRSHPTALPLKSLIQIVGGRTWSISFIRLGDPVKISEESTGGAS